MYECFFNFKTTITSARATADSNMMVNNTITSEVMRGVDTV